MATHNEAITWHDAALYDGGKTYPSTGGKVSSVDGYIKQLLDAGVPRDKLGLGMSFEIRIWKGGSGTATGGATAPFQTWASVPQEWTTGTPLENIEQQSYAVPNFNTKINLLVAGKSRGVCGGGRLAYADHIPAHAGVPGDRDSACIGCPRVGGQRMDI